MSPAPGFAAFVRANSAFLAAGILLSLVSSFGQTFFISIFAGEVMRDFGLTDGQWGLTYTVATGASALAMVWAGGLTDRFRVRRLGAAVVLLLAGACLAMAGAGSLLALTAAIFALRLAGQGMMSHLAVVSMARWFIANRGKALSIAAMGVAFGQAILPVAFVFAMSTAPWRLLWVIAALLVLASLPLMLRLLRAERTPQSLAAEAQSAGMKGHHWRRPELLRHWLFWAMVPLLLGPPAFGTALFFHQVHLTEIKGWDLVDYVALLPLFTVSTIGATFATGALIDRFGSARPMQVYLLPFAAGFAVLAGVQSLWGASLALILFGIGSGAQATVPNAFWAEFYGTRHLGSVKALAAAIMVLGTAIGPGLVGALIDAGHPFAAQMPAIAVYFALAALLAAIAVGRARSQLASAEVDVVGA